MEKTGGEQEWESYRLVFAIPQADDIRDLEEAEGELSHEAESEELHALHVAFYNLSIHDSKSCIEASGLAAEAPGKARCHGERFI